LRTHPPTQGREPVRVVLVGGIDPGTGAGLARDLLTAVALGARAVLVGTAFTEQGEGHAVEPRSPERVRIGLAAALARTGVAKTAVKIGMVASAPIAEAILSALEGFAGPVVYDPVVRASSGGSLYQGDRESVLALSTRATLLTPNLGEAAWLLDRPVRTEMEAREAASALFGMGVRAVLVKGGHLEGDATDVLLSPAGESLFSGPRVAGPSPRGTGCGLATAIAVGLASGESLERAVAAAKTWLTRRIEQATTVGDERHL
jgi:hydroxymethylpyrimidine/phosphomethylpyrimidine kinase